jgi:hypothetical protein
MDKKNSAHSVGRLGMMPRLHNYKAASREQGSQSKRSMIEEIGIEGFGIAELGSLTM